MTSPLSPIDTNSPGLHDDANASGDPRKPSVTRSYNQFQHSAMSTTPPPPVINIPRESFLYCPIQTLAQTLEVTNNDLITTHDLIECYSTLYSRFRSLSNGDEEADTISLLRGSLPTLIRCLGRDISEGLAFFPRPSEIVSGSDASFTLSLEEHEVQSSVDASVLCESALLFTSLLLSLPACASLLSERERAILLDPIIEMCGERYLPVFNADKLCIEAFLCLRTPPVPRWMVPFPVRTIVTTLESPLDRDDEDKVKQHGLKTIHHFLIHAPSHYIQPLLPLLPKILATLTASSISCRMESTYALCGFVVAKWNVLSTMPDLVSSISTQVLHFLDHQGARRSSIQDEYMLPALLKEALRDDDPAWDGQGPVWALVTLSALVVLCDGRIFSHQRSLRLVLDALRYSSRHRLSTVVALHTAVWKSTVWAMSRIFLVSHDIGFSARRDTYERAFRTLVQDMKPGVGTCLVGTLMQDSSNSIDEDFVAWTVEQSIEIVKDLISDGGSRRLEEGLRLLHRLFSSIGSSDYAVGSPVGFDYVPAGLGDGSWLRMSVPELGGVLKSIPPFPLAHIRSLTESEINTHWQDLSELWAMAVERLQSHMTPELLNQLTGIWQALLLCQANLTQGQLHLTASAPFATKLATLITRFLTPTAEPDVRERQLELVGKWWRTITNVFEHSWLSIPAEIVLAGIMSQSVDLGVEGVKRLWSSLCVELVEAGTPTLLHVLHTRVTGFGGREGADLGVTRLLWLILGRRNVRMDVGEQSWVDLAAFLALPFHCSSWEMDDDEWELWKVVLEVTVDAAGGDGVKDIEVVNHIVSQTGEERHDSIYLMLIRASVDLTKVNRCRGLLPILNQILLKLYPTGEKVMAFKVMESLGRFWAVEDSFEIVSSITAVEPAVIMWLEDERGLMEENEHAEMVKAVYVTALESLGRINPKTPDLLSILERFLTSVFSKVTPSAIGPLACLEFWRKHFHRVPTLSGSCSIGLFANLRAFSDVCGESLADNISLVTSSPSTIIADSQSPANLQLRILRQKYSPFAQASGLNVGSEPATPKAAASSSRQPPFFGLGTWQKGTATTMSPLFSQRPGVTPLTRSRPPKRYLTEADLPGGILNDGSPGSDRRPPLKRTKTVSGSVPSPFMTTVPPSQPRFAAGSSSSKGKKPARKFSMRRRLQLAPSSPLPPSSEPEEDDYDSWEARISPNDVLDIRREMQGGNELGDDERGVYGSKDLLGGIDEGVPTEAEEEGDDGDDDVLDPAFTAFAHRSRLRDRSATAPELTSPTFSTSAYPIPHAELPLRRHHSSYAQLEVLQEAYAMVVESDGVSQMDVEELLQLKRLTSRIGQTVDEQIYQQLERGKRSSERGSSMG